jgi:hypothetical protein
VELTLGTSLYLDWELPTRVVNGANSIKQPAHEYSIKQPVGKFFGTHNLIGRLRAHPIFADRDDCASLSPGGRDSPGRPTIPMTSQAVLNWVGQLSTVHH